MKSTFLLLVFAALTSVVMAQPFAIGHMDAPFIDGSRNDRSVPVEIHYPANSAGLNTAVAGTNHPVIVVGHGFLMGIGAYMNIVDVLVPQGYIVGLVDTETLVPDHGDFGDDLAFVVDELKALGANPSILQGKVGPKASIIGHSMGGGATFLAGATANIDCIAALAPAETNPSAIAAAVNIAHPALIFAGEDDCVTPIADHQQPIYNSLASPCKTLIEVAGASHCKFAESNLTCSGGELLCMGSLSRTDQHTIVFEYLLPFYNYHLKGDAAAIVQFDNLLASDTRVNYQQSCTSTAVIPSINNDLQISVFPNPVAEVVTIDWSQSTEERLQLEIIDITGKVVIAKSINKPQNSLTVNVSHIPGGMYYLTIRTDIDYSTLKLIKQ